MQLFLVIVSLLLLAGCNQDIAAVIDNEQTITLQLYEPGKPVFTTTLPEGSYEYRAIIDWAKNNTEGWSLSVITYVPTLLVIGSHFQLNITSTRAVFGYNNEQYEKPLSPEHFAQLRDSLLGVLLQDGSYAAGKAKGTVQGPAIRMNSPLPEMQPNEHVLTAEEIAELPCTLTARRVAGKYPGIVMDSETVTRSDTAGYIYRYDIKRFLDGEGHFVESNGIYLAHTRLVIQTRDREHFHLATYPMGDWGVKRL